MVKIMDITKKDTITALSTPAIPSAIGIIRISGENALDISEKIFSKPLKEIRGGTAVHGFINDGTREIDEVILTIFKSPRSFTGEDVVEISCHGSVYIMNQILKLLIKNGARQAKNGEFTMRAFVNGKLDLTQSEAVADLIDSQTGKEASSALCALKGSISEKISFIREELIGISSQILAYIDYPDDEIEEITPDLLKKKIMNLYLSLEELSDTYNRGKIIKSGLKTVICGKPNAGKSMLMNALLGYERSIVTDIEGTTRDIVEETADFGGMKLILTDTAGIRETDDKVEKIGVERARDKLAEADIIIFVYDLSRPLDEQDKSVLNEIQKTNAKKIAVLNKSDIAKVRAVDELAFFDGAVILSAKTKDGLESLEKQINRIYTEQYGAGENSYENESVLNLRQYECVIRGMESLKNAVDNIHMTPDAILTDIENTISALGEVLGKSVSSEIIENIFSKFCVGK